MVLHVRGILFDIDGTLVDSTTAVERSWRTWAREYHAKPRAHVELGTESFDVIVRELPHAERQRIWTKIIAAEPGFADYQAKTRRVLPVFALRPAS